LDWCDI